MPFGVNPITGLPGPAPKPPRSGDKKQARQRINVEVRTGRRPHPNTLPCTDCGQGDHGHGWHTGIPPPDRQAAKQRKGREVMWIINHEGKNYDIPFDADISVPNIDGRFPNEPMLSMDEDLFQSLIVPTATWVSGAGEFALLAYCRELTITRHKTLTAARESKGMIDGSGCGGGCVKVHVLVVVEASNPRRALRAEKVAAYIRENGLKPMGHRHADQTT